MRRRKNDIKNCAFKLFLMKEYQFTLNIGLKLLVKLDYLFRNSYMSESPVFSGFSGSLDMGRSSHIPS